MLLGDTRLLLAFAFCVGGGTLIVCYASVGPDSWIVYSNFAFLVPAVAAVLRHRRWFVCGLFLFVGAASTAYHETTNMQSSSYSASTLNQLRQMDHVASLYITAVVLTLPFVCVDRLANYIALLLAAGASTTSVWYTMATDLEAVTDVAVALGTPILSQWLQLVFAVTRLRDWRCEQAWNLALLQPLPPLMIGVPLGLVYAWNPYTVSAIVAVALLWPFMMQSILALRSHAWRRASIGETLNLLDLHPVEARAFILVALLLSLGALTLLWAPQTTDDWQYHGLWHVLAANAATFVIWNSPDPNWPSHRVTLPPYTSLVPVY